MAKQLRSVQRARKQAPRNVKARGHALAATAGPSYGRSFSPSASDWPFVLDLYCAKAKLAIEVDGIVHDMGDQPEFDAKRTEWLEGQGVEVLRIPAIDVLRDPVEAADAVVRLCLSRRC